MKHEIIIAGFGGQGIMVAGELLAYAGMLEGKKVSWLPSYGPEMRGGTANCSVVVSDEEISSPVVTEPTVLAVMNLPSLEKFERWLVPNGLLILNTSLVNKEPSRNDINIVRIPCSEVAYELGSDKVANMIVVGALVSWTGMVKMESVVEALKKVFPVHRQDLVPLNVKALEKGREIALEAKSCA